MPEKRPIVTKPLIMRMIGLIDWLYRLGVTDAHEINDDGLAREFLEKINSPGVYGFLSYDGRLISWQEFSLLIVAKARLTSWQGAMTEYFNKMGKLTSNYLGCFIPLAQFFYAKGVRDYMSAPNVADIAEFQTRRRVYWTPKGIRRVSTRQYVDELQIECYNLKRRDEDVFQWNTAYEAAKMGAIRPKRYECFIRALSVAAMTKYT